ncbi:hypothetical protein AB6A40_010550 [Gnathostoma spinigerum]|uniref:Uncharacterized protein n=1 Tax=Gnathostoma spinigerum TaxID=75299 RepID=A0ABD6EVD2_9BILA
MDDSITADVVQKECFKSCAVKKCGTGHCEHQHDRTVCVCSKCTKSAGLTAMRLKRESPDIAFKSTEDSTEGIMDDIMVKQSVDGDSFTEEDRQLRTERGLQRFRKEPTDKPIENLVSSEEHYRE